MLEFKYAVFLSTFFVFLLEGLFHYNVGKSGLKSLCLPYFGLLNIYIYIYIYTRKCKVLTTLESDELEDARGFQKVAGVQQGLLGHFESK